MQQPISMWAARWAWVKFNSLQSLASVAGIFLCDTSQTLRASNQQHTQYTMYIVHVQRGFGVTHCTMCILCVLCAKVLLVGTSQSMYIGFHVPTHSTTSATTSIILLVVYCYYGHTTTEKDFECGKNLLTNPYWRLKNMMSRGVSIMWAATLASPELENVNMRHLVNFCWSGGGQ